MRILYFDGHCNLCNGFVDFLIRHDRRGTLKFASLQGSTAAKNLPPELRGEHLTTVVLAVDSEFYTESTAAIKTLLCLGGIYRFTWFLFLLPRFIRDAGYRWVARHRFSFAGRRETCRLPTAAERAQFLE